MDGFLNRLRAAAITVAALFLAASPGSAQVLKLAVIATDRALDPMADVLTTELSQHAGLTLLERGEINRLLGEQRLGTAASNCRRPGTVKPLKFADESTQRSRIQHQIRIMKQQKLTAGASSTQITGPGKPKIALGRYKLSVRSKPNHLLDCAITRTIVYHDQFAGHLCATLTKSSQTVTNCRKRIIGDNYYGDRDCICVHNSKSLQLAEHGFKPQQPYHVNSFAHDLLRHFRGSGNTVDEYNRNFFDLESALPCSHRHLNLE